MAVLIYQSLIGFVISLVVSSIVIFVATKLLGEQESFGTALIAALIGAIIYTFAYHLLGGGIIASMIGWVAWVIALGSLYNIGWIKSFVVAIVIWFFAAIVSSVLPTIMGPL